MLLVTVIRPDVPGAGERQCRVQHLHTRIVGPDHLRLKQYLLERPIQRGQQIGALRQPATHGLPRDFHAVTLKDLFLPVQRQMVEPLAHDHLCQQTGSGRALFDRLGWLGRRLHRAGTRVFFAHILDHRQLCWNEFVALTRLFPNGSQILLTDPAVLF